MEVIKAVKKPIEIEAVKYDGTKESATNIVRWMTNEEDAEASELTIQTLEGELKASPGDYIIRGIKGEYYPCKPDIFEESYDILGAKCQPTK